MSELQSYKPYARIVSCISAIIIILASLDATQVIQLFPDYASQINSILVIAGILAPIIAQEKRVVRAEDLVHEQYADVPAEPENVVVNLTLNGEEIVSDTETQIGNDNITNDEVVNAADEDSIEIVDEDEE